MEESAYVCMHAHTFCCGAVFLLPSRPYKSHLFLGKKNIVVALSQVCGYI